MNTGENIQHPTSHPMGVEKPLPCPFCGAKPKVRWNEMHTDECESFWSAGCPGRPRPCTGNPMSFGPTAEVALENWNLRTPIERVDIAEVRE